VFNSLHGGVTSTLIDIAGSLAILAGLHPTSGSSIELNVSFLSGAQAGETLDLFAECVKAGKQIGFTTVRVMCGDRTVAVGRHTKYYQPDAKL
jgi:acyl-coenzyme A thioesterase 13